MKCSPLQCSRRKLWQSLALATAQIVLALLIAFSPRESSADASIVGDWHGDIDSPSGPLTVIVTLSETDGAMTAAFQVPSQAPGVTIPTDDLQYDGETLEFRIPRASARYRGRFNAEARRIEGTFHQGIEMTLNLRPGLPPAAAVIDGLDGRWVGELDRNGTRLRLALNVSTTDAGTIATLDSPDMGATGLPVTDLARDGDRVDFNVPVASVRFSAELDPESNSMCGDWLRPGQPDARVCLERSPESAPAAQRPSRPQEPGDEVPYQRRDVTFVNHAADGIELAGTLTLPLGDGPFPAAVLISGSGPQDRDETFMGHKPFLVLADHLTRHGIAVLRYDDRGHRESGGDHWAATTADFATDSIAAVNWLAAQPGIRADSIGLIGHSEGGLIAPMAANDDDRVAWVVLLAAPGVNMLELVARQTEAMAISQGMSREQLDRVLPIQRSIWRIIAGTEDLEQARAKLDRLLTPEALATLGAGPERKPAVIGSALRPWVRYLLRFDPAPYLRSLEIPVLALNGSVDIQVPAGENLAAIRDNLSDNPDATVLELPGLNHLFQTAETGAIGEYRDIEETFAPGALEIIHEWVLARNG